MKRILSIVLTLAMLASTFVLAIPTVSAAEEDNLVYTEVATLDQFVAALAAKQNIKLTADITLKKNTKYQLYTTTTLNGNGHTIYIPEMNNNNAPIAWAVDSTMANPKATTTIKNVNFGSEDYPFVHRNTSQTSLSLFTGLSSGYDVLFENVNAYYTVITTKAAYIGAFCPSLGGSMTFNNCNVYSDTQNLSSASGGFIGETAATASLVFNNCNAYGEITNVASTASGFIGMLKGSVVMNNCNNYATCKSPSTAGVKFSVGGFVAYATSAYQKIELNNCTNYGIVESGKTAGGLVGMVEGTNAYTKLTGCKNYGSVEITDQAAEADTTKIKNVAGIIASVQGATLIDCVNYGNVGAGFGNAGGMLGWIKNVTMSGCINYGNIAGYSNAGGLIGYGDSGSSTVKLTNCMNYGNIKNFESAGCSGGMIAWVRNPKLDGCANFGTVTSGIGGGLFGNVSGATVKNTINAGPIYGERNDTCCIGGFVGLSYSVNFENCANIGAVTMMHGKNYGVGNYFGILYNGTATMNNCYAFAPVVSYGTFIEGVIAGVVTNSTINTTGCKYIDYGASTANLGSDCKKVTAADALALLKSTFDLDAVVGENGKIVIATPTIRGLQSTQPVNGKQSIRVLATMGKAINVMKNVGFKLQFIENGVAGEVTEYSTDKVMVSVNNRIGITTEKISADQMFGDYIFTAQVDNVPTTGTFVIKATPWISDGTETYYGETKTISFENGVYTTDAVDTSKLLPSAEKYGTPLPQKANTALYKKSVLFAGDSITYGSQDRGVYSPTRTWAGRIAYVHDMEYVNAGIPSAGVSDARAAYSIIVDQIEKYKDREFDFIMLHGGVNDAWGTNGSAPTPVGTITPMGTTTFDRTTFAGGLENLLYNAKQWFPNAKIGYIINFYAPNELSGTVSEMSEYVDMTKLICDKYDIPYVDLYYNQELTDALLVTSRDAATQKTYIPDHIHPNAGGYDLIYPYIEEFMETKVAGGVSSAEPEYKLAINGVDISNYQIIYKAPADAATLKNYWRPEYDAARITAERLADLIEANYGVKIPVYSDKNAPETAYEILVGKTNRAASSAETITSLTTDQYYVGVSGSKLLICGGADGTTWHAVDAIEAYLTGATPVDNVYNINQRINASGTYHLQRVAFIGDSITYAAISTDYLNNGGMFGYPKQAGRIDWKESVVTPYGSAGTAMTGYMGIKLWTTFCNDAKANPYDVVVIMLGINDANVADKASGWNDTLSASFTTALENMIRAIDDMNPNAEIVVMTCCVHYRTAAAGYTSSNPYIVSSANVVALQKEIALRMKNAGYNVHLYDMEAYSTENTTKAMFNSDHLHPADAGHEVLARGVAKMLQMLRDGETDQYLLY